MEDISHLLALDRLYEYIQSRTRGIREKDLISQADPKDLKNYLSRLIKDNFIYTNNLFVRGEETTFYYVNNSIPFESYVERHKYDNDLKHLQRKKALYDAANAKLQYDNYKIFKWIAILGIIISIVSLIISLRK